jgi:hypothetical protein
MKVDVVVQVPQINMRAPLKPTRRGPPGAPGNSENETGGCIDFVGSKQCCRSGMFISDPGSRVHFFPSWIPVPGSRIEKIRIRIKEFKYF